MSKKNHLKFSEDGKEVQIVFKDGKGSVYYTSQKECAGALSVLKGAKRITEKEEDAFIAEIAVATKLPFSNAEERRSRHTSGMGFGGPLLAMLALGSIFDGIGMEDDEPVEVALFKMCGCGTNHAKILSREVKATPLFSKEDARDAAEQMEKGGHITADEKVAILTQIEASPLPEEQGTEETEKASAEAAH